MTTPRSRHNEEAIHRENSHRQRQQVQRNHVVLILRRHEGSQDLSGMASPVSYGDRHDHETRVAAEDHVAGGGVVGGLRDPLQHVAEGVINLRMKIGLSVWRGVKEGETGLKGYWLERLVGQGSDRLVQQKVMGRKKHVSPTSRNALRSVKKLSFKKSSEQTTGTTRRNIRMSPRRIVLIPPMKGSLMKGCYDGWRGVSIRGESTRRSSPAW